MRSRLEPMKRFARMIKAHLPGIPTWTRVRVRNGSLQGNKNQVKGDPPPAHRLPKAQTRHPPDPPPPFFPCGGGWTGSSEAVFLAWEERHLRARFGGDFDRYARTVPRWFLIRPRRPEH